MLDQATRLREIADRYSGQPSSTRPHIITVTSGKGGVGKSTVALNLAVTIAHQGNSTLLLDADENLGSIDVMVGAAPTCRLGSVLSGERDIEDIILPLSTNLSLLPADSGNTTYQRMTVEQQRALLRGIADLEQRYDYVVIDTAAGLGREVIGFAVRSHETLVVTTPDPTAVMDAYAIIKLITAADPMVPVKVVVNAARQPGEAEETARKLQMVVRHFLRRHVHYLGSIPHDDHVGRAIARQSPLVSEFPSSSASLAFNRLTETILEQAARTRGRRFETG